ncbi:hypothetical protein AB6E16_17835 [Vibrio atlanticus]|uniref:hypothetical protein n=1 Tax=Vibrio TaxID=662 RepID=UPI0002E53DEA|nr:hypothetical protein [Vibrio cyclitrophicus]OEF33039.1 hypothetical protein OA9_18985 [Vibrio cyclitrophicus 1F97]
MNDVKNVDVNLEDILAVTDLESINLLLTKSMAKQKIQALIKGDLLSQVVDKVVDIAIQKNIKGSSSEEGRNTLLAAAILGRLGAVARARESTVYTRLDEIFSLPLTDLESLADGDEKYYAALALSYHKSSWLVQYCLEQAISLDTSEKARGVLFTTALNNLGDLSSFWNESSKYLGILKSIEANDKRYKRVRRITAACFETTRGWRGEVGVEPGVALSNWLETLIITNKTEVEHALLTDIFDDLLLMLKRIIELRFSFALQASTYAALEKSKSYFGREIWGSLVSRSKCLSDIRVCLLETALVLARQGNTDASVAKVLSIAYLTRSEASRAVKKHFKGADDLAAEQKSWWLNVGLERKDKREVQHQLGNSEDQQIGSLLIEVESSQEAMNKLSRAVVPMLQISNPPLAETVKKAAAGYADIERITRQLARMRKITSTDLKGSFMDYNPMQHELLGGHKLGIRNIRVVREGIQKDFGGKLKMLVKPWVEPVKSEY